MAKRIYDRWPGYSVEDCDCKYCLYYGGSKGGEVNCLLDECCCKEELMEAIVREKGLERMKKPLEQDKRPWWEREE